jgi:hypothetical protein
MREPEGVENLAKWARNYFSVYNHFYEITPEGKKSYRNLKKIISESNLFLLDTMKELAIIFETKQYLKNKSHLMENYREEIKSKHLHFRKKILITMARLVTLVENQQTSINV